jgi:predicted metal-dependent enzyme (double-stranded beta helix superfamily)
VSRTHLAFRPASRRRHLGVAELSELALEFVPRASLSAAALPKSKRSWALLGATSEYEVFVNTWPAGGSIELHDHGDSAGAVVVVSGELTETRIVSRAGNIAGTRVETFTAGDLLKLELGCVHDVVNQGPLHAVSVHAYSPRLRSMTFFNKIGTTLDPVRTLRYGS